MKRWSHRSWRYRLLPSTLRWKITVAYVIGLATVMAAILAVGYAALGAELTAAAREDLTVRLGDLSTAGAAGVDADPYAQLIMDGVVTHRSPATPTSPVLTATELARAASQPIVIRRTAQGLGDDALLAAGPAQGGAVLVAGTSLAAANRATTQILHWLLIAGPILIAGLAFMVRRLVDAALRPVGALTAEASAITRHAADRRLPEPAGRDEIATLARTLNGMLDRLDAAYQREHAFIDEAAHELRTPVAVLRAELEIGLASDDPAEGRRALRVALVEADRVGRLAADLLLLARARAGQLAADRQPTDVTSEIRTWAHQLGQLTGITVGVSGPELVATVDPVRLRQLITNLVTNGAQAGAGVIDLRVGQGPAGGITLTVDDDGRGFPASLLPGAFERFSGGGRTPGRATGSGTGLGLAIVAEIAHAHGGSVRASNTAPLGGARVHVVLPGGSHRPSR